MRAEVAKPSFERRHHRLRSGYHVMPVVGTCALRENRAVRNAGGPGNRVMPGPLRQNVGAAKERKGDGIRWRRGGTTFPAMARTRTRGKHGKRRKNGEA